MIFPTTYLAAQHGGRSRVDSDRQHEIHLVTRAFAELARDRSRRPDGPAIRELSRYLWMASDRGVRAVLVQHARSHHNLSQLREDLVQAALVRLVEDDFGLVRSWDPARRSLRGWVGMLARQRTLNTLSQQRRLQRSERPASDRLFDLGVSDSPPSSRVEDRQLLAQIQQRVLEQATPALRQLFELWFVEDHSVAKISELTGKKAGAIYRAIHRLRTLARAARDDLNGEGSP